MKLHDHVVKEEERWKKNNKDTDEEKETTRLY